MRVKLAYGKESLWVELPDDNVTVLEPRYVPGLPNESEALRAVLRSPTGTRALRELVTPDDTVAVVGASSSPDGSPGARRQEPLILRS